jgi:hypothetical protein
MKEWEKLSSVELGELLQRLYLRMEQYEIHATSLTDSPQRDVAIVLAERMRERLGDVSGLLDRRIAEAIGLDAHTQAARMVPSAARRAGTSGN